MGLDPRTRRTASCTISDRVLQPGVLRSTANGMTMRVVAGYRGSGGIDGASGRPRK
jgi:hypothetical protein